MTRYWCMRYEAKHSYFKDLAQKIKCFKNIPKSLAERHQLFTCYNLLDSQSLVKEIKLGRSKNLPVNKVFLFVSLYTLIHMYIRCVCPLTTSYYDNIVGVLESILLFTLANVVTKEQVDDLEYADVLVRSGALSTCTTDLYRYFFTSDFCCLSILLFILTLTPFLTAGLIG